MGKSRRMKEVVSYVEKYHSEHGYAPTYDEIMQGIGLKSKSSVYSYIQELLELGVLETDTERTAEARAIRVARKCTQESKMLEQILFNQTAIMAVLQRPDSEIAKDLMNECLKSTREVLEVR